MVDPRLFLCSGASLPTDDSRSLGRKVVFLDSLGSNSNINLRVEDVSKKFAQHLSSRMVDLIEIATYVYAADCSTPRGTAWVDGVTEAWSRDFLFRIPVRDLAFWKSEEVQKHLKRIVQHLSNDNATFEFCQLTQERPQQEYLQFGNEHDWPFQNVERVLMFSGGLDSLAGAVESAVTGKNLVLVSHRTVATLDSRQRKLYERLKEFSTEAKVESLHVPVWINKNSSLGREATQRTRSFLYCSLGTVVAESIKAGGVRFFENGIVSLNWPVADEVLQARASQTTHPLVLHYFSEFFSLVLNRSFVIDNPFIFKTKAEVIKIIADRNASHLIEYTCSCAHTMFKSRTQWHCGTCSQCIDRRIAMLAAGQAKFDPKTDYVSDVFTGERKVGYEQNMAVDYVRHGVELAKLSESQMAENFNLELTRASRYFPDRREAATSFIEMHHRHGKSVKEVIGSQVQKNANALLEGSLDPTCLLAKVAGQAHKVSPWRRYSAFLVELLQKGLPAACASHKPKNEPHLQEICEGIFKSRDSDLIREFPYMSWSSSKTKPDWSSDSLSLWVELKYVRQKSDIRTITEDIAADITKYGDNTRKVLFLIYDPLHLIPDDNEFCRPILARENLLVAIIR